MFSLLLGLQLFERRKDSHIDSKRPVELGTVLASIPDAVFLFDAEGRIVECNRAAEELCDRNLDQLRRMSIAELNAMLSARDESDRPVATPAMGVNRALRGEVVRDLRRVFRHPKDGHTVESVTSTTPLRESSGEITGALLIVRDTTELSSLQRQLSDSQRHMEVGRMAAGLAHDFSNVLHAILQALSLLSNPEKLSANDLRTYITMIERAATRGTEIIGRVRDFLRSASEERSYVDLAKVLQEVVELTDPLCESRKEIKVKLELLSEVPHVYGNAADLRRVFTNLVINALEAMPNGGQLTVRCEVAAGDVRAIISDTGNGISAEQQRQLFVPYFTTKPQGTGLGLSGAQRIVSAMGGRIRVRSDLGKGTTFMVELPIPNPAESDQPQQTIA